MTPAVTTGAMPAPFAFWTSPSFVGRPQGFDADSFEDLSDMLDEHAESPGSSVADKLSAPLLFAGAFQSGATDKSAASLDMNALPPFIMSDLDGLGSLSAEQTVARVARLVPEVRLDVWTTYSHGGPKGTRMRALVALTRGPKDGEEYGLAWAAVGTLLGVLGPDTVCSDLTRGQAFPSAPVGRRPYCDHLAGHALDTDSLVRYARTRGLTAPTMPAREYAECPPHVGLYVAAREDLEEYVVQAARLGKRQLAPAMHVLHGRPVAPQGERYVAARDLVASFWHYIRREHNAWLDPRSMELLFADSLHAMARTSNQPLDVVALVDGYAPKGEARHVG